MNFENREVPKFSVEIVDVKNLIPDIKETDPDVQYDFSGDENPQDFQRFMIKELAEYSEVTDLPTFFEKFRDKIVVSLGPGMTVSDYKVIQMSGAKGYIAVEPFHSENLLSALKNYKSELPTIPAAVVEQDALSFLQRLPKDSVCIFVSALDEYIIEDQHYIDQVNGEILRTLDPEGAFVNFDSVFLLDQQSGIEAKHADMRSRRLSLYKKSNKY